MVYAEECTSRYQPFRVRKTRQQFALSRRREYPWISRRDISRPRKQPSNSYRNSDFYDLFSTLLARKKYLRSYIFTRDCQGLPASTWNRNDSIRKRNIKVQESENEKKKKLKSKAKKKKKVKKRREREGERVKIAGEKGETEKRDEPGKCEIKRASLCRRIRFPTLANIFPIEKGATSRQTSRGNRIIYAKTSTCIEKRRREGEGGRRRVVAGRE